MMKNVLRHSNLLGRHLAISVLCTVFLLLYSHTYSRAKSSPHQAVLHSELSGGQMIKSLQCFANNDLFAVGGRNDQGPPARLLRFDGRQWHETKIASLGGFNGIWGSSPLHVFAVGGLPGEIWYYNGEGWHLSYRGGPLDNLHGVWGCAPNNVWVVGQHTDGGGGIVLHYDGTAWTRSANFGHGFLRIWGFACKDIWSTGARPPHRPRNFGTTMARLGLSIGPVNRQRASQADFGEPLRGNCGAFIVVARAFTGTAQLGRRSAPAPPLT